MKVKIIQPSLGTNQQDSFWYNGQIAIIKTDHGTYSLEACGDIKVVFDDETYYQNHNAVKEALDRNYTDENLNENVEFDTNNWFEVVLIADDKNIGAFSTVGDIAYTYDDGIEILKECAK
jgi:hypothetical protein